MFKSNISGSNCCWSLLLVNQKGSHANLQRYHSLLGYYSKKNPLVLADNPSLLEQTNDHKLRNIMKKKKKITRVRIPISTARNK